MKYFTNKAGLLVVGSVLTLCLVFSFWSFGGGEEVSQTSPAMFRVGAILPLSGTAAFYGEQAKKGMEVAREMQGDSSKEIALSYEDSEYTAEGGLSAYRRLSSKDLNGVIVLASSVAIPLSSEANADQVLELAIGTSSDKYSSKDDFTARTTPLVGVQNRELAKYLQDEQAKTVGLLYLKNDFGSASASDFKEKLPQSINLVADEGYLLDTVDFRPYLSKLKQYDPEYIYIAGTAKQYAEILKSAQELELNSKFLSTYSAEDPVVLSAGDAAVRLIYAYGFDPEDRNNAEARSFAEQYKSKYGELPDSFAAEGYEAYRLFVKALKVCGGDGVCLQSQFTQGRQYDTVFGTMSFDEYGDVSYPFFLKTVRDGKFVRL